MLLQKVKNISNEDVDISLSCGTVVTLPPHAQLGHCDVVNMNEISGKVTYLSDLTEVVRPSGKQRILG